MANIDLPITNTRKAELASKYGRDGTVTSESWAKAAIDDVSGLFRLYDADAWYLYSNVGDKPSGATGGGGGGGGGETPVAPSPAIVTWTGKASVPSKIEAGKEYWFGMELKNSGETDWRGYLGIRINTDGEDVFVYAGDRKYAQTIKAGETKMLWCKVAIPENTSINDSTRVYLARYEA